MLNNKLAGRTICVGGPHAARGPPVGQPCFKVSSFALLSALSTTGFSFLIVYISDVRTLFCYNTNIVSVKFNLNGSAKEEIYRQIIIHCLTSASKKMILIAKIILFGFKNFSFELNKDRIMLLRNLEYHESYQDSLNFLLKFHLYPEEIFRKTPGPSYDNWT